PDDGPSTTKVDVGSGSIATNPVRLLPGWSCRRPRGSGRAFAAELEAPRRRLLASIARAPQDFRKRLAIQRTMTPEPSKAAGHKIACMAICRTCAWTMRLYLVAASAFALANTSGGTVVWELRGTIITIRN